MLSTIFKPVIAASIAAALEDSVTASGGAATATSTSGAEAATMSLRDVKQLLMLNGQDTWGSEPSLRHRLEMFAHHRLQSTGAHWDSTTQSWLSATPMNNVLTAATPFAVPAKPADFAGAQWSPVEQAVGATVAPPAPAPAAAPAPAPPAAVAVPPAPAPEAAPAPAPPAAPAGDKSTYTVLLKTPDGDKSFECDPEMYMLDQAEELDNAEDFEDLPYACRAGSCSACAGKLVSGTVDTSACTFLTPDQIKDGWVLTCTCKPTSDCVIETHKEDDLY